MTEVTPMRGSRSTGFGRCPICQQNEAPLRSQEKHGWVNDWAGDVIGHWWDEIPPVATGEQLANLTRTAEVARHPALLNPTVKD